MNSVKVRFDDAEVDVTYDPTKIGLAGLTAGVQKAGFGSEQTAPVVLEGGAWRVTTSAASVGRGKEIEVRIESKPEAEATTFAIEAPEGLSVAGAPIVVGGEAAQGAATVTVGEDTEPGTAAVRLVLGDASIPVEFRVE